MAELRFYYGTMASGKSTMALQIHHNLREAGRHGLLCTQLSRVDAAVSSRLGVAEPAIEVEADIDLATIAQQVIEEHGSLHYMVCDEAQFYTELQIQQLAEIVDHFDCDVYAFGLLTDFRGRLFEGSARLMELADQRHGLQVEARCWCGRPATMNARLVDGKQVYDGDVVVIADTGSVAPNEVSYELLCRRHWMEGSGQNPPPVSVSSGESGISIIR